MKKIHFSGNTEVGKLRLNNEDNLIFRYIWDDKHVLGVVIDGIGGEEGGEVAARIAKETIEAYLEKSFHGDRLRLLQWAVTEANNQIFKERQNQPDLSNMGCVLSACLVEVEKKRINMVHVGDTRLYQFYDGKLEKLSHDHSDVGYREDMGILSEYEAMRHPRRYIINRLLGDKLHQADDEDFIEAKSFDLSRKPFYNIFMLCSDGLTDLVTRDEISGILSQSAELEQKIQKLIDLANNKGGKDNITVVLIEYQSDEMDNIENAENNPTTEPCSYSMNIHKNDRSKGGKRNLIITLMIIMALLIGAVGGWYGNDKYRSTHKDTGTADTEIEAEIPENDPTVNDNVSDEENDENN